MKRTYSKNYFEKYAAISLSSMYQIDINLILQSDCPDLQILSKNIGIEVTQALTPEEAVEDKKKQLYCHIDTNPFNSFEEDKDFLKWKIQDALNRKEKKAKHYKVFHTNALYIFTHCYNFNEEDILSCFEDYSFENSFYQFIYLNCVQNVYCLSLCDKKIHKYSFTLQQLFDMNKHSLEYEKTCTKVRKEIIINK